MSKKKEHTTDGKFAVTGFSLSGTGSTIKSTNQDTVEKSTYQGFSASDARIGGFSLSGSCSTNQDTVEKTAHPGFSFLSYNKVIILPYTHSKQETAHSKNISSTVKDVITF